MRLWAIIIFGGVLLGYGLTQSAPVPEPAGRIALADAPATPAAKPVPAPMPPPRPVAAATAVREAAGIAPPPNRGQLVEPPAPPCQRPRHRRRSEQPKSLPPLRLPP